MNLGFKKGHLIDKLNFACGQIDIIRVLSCSLHEKGSR